MSVSYFEGQSYTDLYFYTVEGKATSEDMNGFSDNSHRTRIKVVPLLPPAYSYDMNVGLVIHRKSTKFVF
jgi:hypothetical protein